ncbi:MAG: ribosome biogenesis GTPase Der, partial [Clostridia bacterium]|nr:ribosome biogenesis GTPase Der [Clostridia bacterium]
DAVYDKLPDFDGEADDDDRIKVAVIGKPNAGKSSIINKILGENRLIVSNIAGTTRDAIDTAVENEYGKYTFIDTAGIRRQSRVDDKIEKYSVLRAKMAVERADVCLIVIDAEEGITEQDEKIAGIAHEAGKASIIVVNKWDLIEKDNSTTKRFTEKIYNALSYMTYAPLIFVSAKTGQRLEKLFEHINYINNQACTRITTGMLNDMLADATARVQPPSDKGRRLKIYYMTQTSIKPPSFVIFCNDIRLFHYSYQRYIENQIREVFGFKGTPIRFVLRQRGDET